MRLLHIIATPRGHESNTTRVSNVFIEALYARYDDLTVGVLDLFKADLPAVAGANIENNYKLMTGQALDDSHKSSWEAIEANIKRFLEADMYVISTPLWNLSIPYALKYYIDAIIQPGYLYHYDANGVPEGLAKGKRMLLVISSGGDYSAASPLHAFDFAEPYLKAIFGFVGISDIQVIRAQPMDITPAARRAALLQATDAARALAASSQWDVPRPAASTALPIDAKPAALVDSLES